MNNVGAERIIRRGLGGPPLGIIGRVGIFHRRTGPGSGLLFRRRPELATQGNGEPAEIAHQVEELVRQQRLRSV